MSKLKSHIARAEGRTRPISCHLKRSYHIVKHSLIIILALLVLGSAAWCAEETVLRIGDKSISVEEFEKTAQKLRETGYSHVEELDQQGKQELLDGVIARELLIAEALRRGYDRDSAIAQAVAKSERKALMNKLYELGGCAGVVFVFRRGPAGVFCPAAVRRGSTQPAHRLRHRRRGPSRP